LPNFRSSSISPSEMISGGQHATVAALISGIRR
jgi:hypothetical protein